MKKSSSVMSLKKIVLQFGMFKNKGNSTTKKKQFVMLLKKNCSAKEKVQNSFTKRQNDIVLYRAELHCYAKKKVVLLKKKIVLPLGMLKKN